MRPIIAPSLLACDFSKLADEVNMINSSTAEWIHIDIMDGVFVPNLSMGVPIVEAIHRHAKKTMDVHLMIVRPERYIEAFIKAGADVLSVHIEACLNVKAVVGRIKALGIKAGVAINPYTPVTALENVIADVDVVNIMSVNPGFGGQELIPSTFEKVIETKKLIDRIGSKALIEIDGGVNLDNAKALIKAGADVLVAGNFVFNTSQPTATIEKLKASAN
ncbi:MAG TPA: ribulose-phosphate 3-epimerase [Cyclobacteriaceae bacterium]|nr:ribulose-phosphate 3-epimerase [Cyclobacteriaceae bacterium]